jgi:hypothetical protein
MVVLVKVNRSIEKKKKDFQISFVYLALSHGPEKERPINPDFEFVRDYSALNKAALEAGMTSAKDQSRFRLLFFLLIMNLTFFFF